MSSYLKYYIASLLCNALLVSFYAVQVFTTHKPCLVENTNITSAFERAFCAGLVLAMLNCLNSNVLLLYAHCNQQMLVNKFGESYNASTLLYKASIFLEWILGIITLGVSVLQFLIVKSQTGYHCRSLNRRI